MDAERIVTSATRVTVVVLVLFIMSFVIDMIWDDLSWSNFHVFVLPFAFGSLIYLIFSFREVRFSMFRRRSRYTAAILSFLFMVFLGSLPFMLTEHWDPVSAVFESTAGFTTTGLSIFGAREITEMSHGLMFFRVAIQWVGGFFYLVFAFMFLSDISDLAQRSVDRRIFSRIGLVPKLSFILQNLATVYVIFTLLSFLSVYISGQSLFDSICLSLATVSTGGFSSSGRVLTGGWGLMMMVAFFMFLSGMGYYVHLSLMSARGRRRTFFDSENVIYLTMVFVVPIVSTLILASHGIAIGSSLRDGIFASISALSTTGFMVEGMDSWPDSMRFLLLLLMLIGGSSLSVASGFKVQRSILLVKGFLGEVRRSSHPSAVVMLRRGEGTYSDKALESANMSFFYLFALLAISMTVLLLFADDMFDALSLCVTSLSNSGMAFGIYSTAEGIAGLNWFVKLVLALMMLLGRFEILLPLYVLSLRGKRFTG
ncbi:MAG: hypothetical protein DRN57_04565 [Thermoplasmata archaeon]|nr:MAG: hypothetical protein DRN57_04565 [Thermoplasmata archaeon]